MSTHEQAIESLRDPIDQEDALLVMLVAQDILLTAINKGVPCATTGLALHISEANAILSFQDKPIDTMMISLDYSHRDMMPFSMITMNHFTNHDYDDLEVEIVDVMVHGNTSPSASNCGGTTRTWARVDPMTSTVHSNGPHGRILLPSGDVIAMSESHVAQISLDTYSVDPIFRDQIVELYNVLDSIYNSAQVNTDS